MVVETSQTLIILILALPTINELIDNYNLETAAEKKNDTAVRIVTALVVSAVDPRMYLQDLALCVGIFFFAFDYLYNLTSKITKPVRAQWFSHLGSTAWFDRQFVKLNPWLRFGIRVVCLLAAILFYTL